MKLIEFLGEASGPTDDKYFDVTGLDANGYSKEFVEHISTVVRTPSLGPMTSEELDDLLGI